MIRVKLSSRAAVIEAAFLTFATHPTATLTDVAKTAGVGRATLHRHFASRDALMETLARVAMEELNAAVEDATKNATSYGQALEQTLHAIIPLANRQWFLSSDTAAMSDDLTELYAKDRAKLCDAIEHARIEGLFSSDATTDWIADVFDALVYAAWGQVRDEKLTPKQAANLAWTTFINGVGK